MYDFSALTTGFFLLGFLVLIILIGFKFISRLAAFGQSSNNYSEETDKQLRKDSREDSEADLAMTTEDDNSWMFPPEFEDDDDV